MLVGKLYSNAMPLLTVLFSSHVKKTKEIKINSALEIRFGGIQLDFIGPRIQNFVTFCVFLLLNIG